MTDQFKLWLTFNPSPPNAVYLIPHPQPKLKFECELCGRPSSCTKAYRHFTGRMFHVCCKCLYLNQSYWLTSAVNGISSKMSGCQHSLLYGREKFLKHKKQRIEQHKITEARRRQLEFKFETTMDEKHFEKNVCPICHGRFQVPVQTECGHTFCLTCLHLWVQSKQPGPNCQGPDCPLCRTSFTTLFN